MLSDRDILRHMELGCIKIDPWTEHQAAVALQPASIDLRINTADVDQLCGEFYILSNGTLVLPAGSMVLASTVETVTICTKVACRVEGKSSWGRMGLIVHATAGFIDPGWSGPITLEMKNLVNHDIFIPAQSWISQVCFYQLQTPASVPYQGYYAKSTGTRRSRFAVDPQSKYPVDASGLST